MKKKNIVLLAIIVIIIIAGVFCYNKYKKQEEKGNLKLTAPASYFCNHFQTFFNGDEYVTCEAYDSKTNSMNVGISDMDKYASMFKCWNGGHWKFGSQKFMINFRYTGEDVPPNVELGSMYDTDIENLFKGNKYFKETHKEKEGFQFYYVMLKPEVIQTYIDNLTSPFGVDTLSAESLCKDILFKGCELGVQFCSDKKE